MPTSITVLDNSGTPQTVNTLPALGQALKAASLPVTIASDQGTINVSSVVTSLPALPTGSNVIGAVTQSGSWTVAGSGTFAISAASLPLPSGASTSANQSTVITALGTTTDAAAANGAAGSALAYLRAIKDGVTSNTPAPVIGPGSYKSIAASTSNAQCGATGAIGDFLSHVTIIPASTSPGSVTIQDGSGTAITIFAGGATSVSSLASFSVQLGMKATGAGWEVNTGANVSVIAVGSFT